MAWLPSLEERFFSRVRESGDCWEWTGAASRGYGSFRAGPRTVPAHRWAYEFMVGEIPAGLHLDHLCRNTLCVNPAHLDPVTTQVNTARGMSWSARNAAKTHCKSGHEFTPENTRPISGGGRRCLACYRPYQNEYHKEYQKRARRQKRAVGAM